MRLGQGLGGHHRSGRDDGAATTAPPTTVAAATTAAATTTAAASTTTAKATTTSGAATTKPAGSTPAASGNITVFAAASLTESFNEIGDAFTTENPDANVTFNFAASSDLVTQINEGAPADVFASADQSNMTKLTDAGGQRRASR